MNITEFVAALITLSSVIMLANGKMSGWILGIIGSLLYGFLFFQQKLYANMFLQLIFITQGVYGIYEWDKEKETDFSSKKLDFILFLNLLFAVSGICIVLLLSLSLYGENTVLDLTLSMFSILAMLMMAKKYVQSWFVWIGVDIGYLYLFFSTNMFISAILYFILLIMCINGYIKWSKNVKKIKY